MLFLYSVTFQIKKNTSILVYPFYMKKVFLTLVKIFDSLEFEILLTSNLSDGLKNLT